MHWEQSPASAGLFDWASAETPSEDKAPLGVSTRTSGSEPATCQVRSNCGVPELVGGMWAETAHIRVCLQWWQDVAWKLCNVCLNIVELQIINPTQCAHMHHHRAFVYLCRIYIPWTGFLLSEGTSQGKRMGFFLPLAWCAVRPPLLAWAAVCRSTNWKSVMAGCSALSDLSWSQQHASAKRRCDSNFLL